MCLLGYSLVPPLPRSLQQEHELCIATARVRHLKKCETRQVAAVLVLLDKMGCLIPCQAGAFVVLMLRSSSVVYSGCVRATWGAGILIPACLQQEHRLLYLGGECVAWVGLQCILGITVGQAMLADVVVGWGFGGGVALLWFIR